MGRRARTLAAGAAEAREAAARHNTGCRGDYCGGDSATRTRAPVAAAQCVVAEARRAGVARHQGLLDVRRSRVAVPSACATARATRPQHVVATPRHTRTETAWLQHEIALEVVAVRDRADGLHILCARAWAHGATRPCSPNWRAATRRAPSRCCSVSKWHEPCGTNEHKQAVRACVPNPQTRKTQLTSSSCHLGTMSSL